MNRNASARVVLEDQIDGIPMESRIARIESDVAHLKQDVSDIKQDLREMRGDIKACKEDIASLKEGQAELRAEMHGGFAAIREEMKAQISGLEVRMLRWVVGTAVGCAGVAFSLAKYLP